MNNSSNNSLSQENLNALLGLTSKKLGTDPQKLRSQLEKGNITDLVKSLSGDDAAQINKMINDPKELEKLLNNPQVKDILGKLMKNK
ncbi:MAG: hypothetical protein RRZ73_00170 [Oscillospiraceae bacterium]